ncbi:hypothetical protein R50073_42790 [Maricurvus nonylphenolicus]|uniref:hypothetical protein n=1 Tax=Maricurvus nonylphenolicus TaxID=1008307 RepID=UPI0036F43DED
MKHYLKKGIDAVSPLFDRAVEEITANISSVKEIVNGLPVFVSLEKSDKYQDTEYDEKHYFIIPYELSEYKFALHTMRCLPDDVPEINNLPKRRVFHFANEHAEIALKHYMLESAKEVVEDKYQNTPSTLESLANDIDALDAKLTYGMLLVGAAAAIVNPVVGAGIAAKAILPGVAEILTKYGLRPAGEKISKIQLEKEVRQAEVNITKQFESSDTLRVVNPILQELELALRTNEREHDPLTDPNLANGSISELPNERWRELTETAIFHAYKDVYEDDSQHQKAKLGPEDLRWLKTIFENFRAK